MPAQNLDEDGSRRLTQVLQLIAGNVNALTGAINKVLADVSDRARRIYLRNKLSRLAKAKLRDRRRSGLPQKITWAMIKDAPGHEAELIRNIPKQDL